MLASEKPYAYREAYPMVAKTVTVAVIVKGFTMAVVLFAVLNSGLSDFEKALIVATVSATITGLFTVLGAWIAARRMNPVRDKINEVHEDMHDVKEKVNASNRSSDR